MKTILLIIGTVCMTACQCFAQETGVSNRYSLTKTCVHQIKVYQSVNHHPYLAHYKYMSPRYWIIKADDRRHRSDSGYVKIYIPDNETVAEAKSLWNNDGQTVDKSDYNTWLYIEKKDLGKFKTLHFSDDYSLALAPYYQQMAAQNSKRP